MNEMIFTQTFDRPILKAFLFGGFLELHSSRLIDYSRECRLQLEPNQQNRRRFIFPIFCADRPKQNYPNLSGQGA